MSSQQVHASTHGEGTGRPLGPRSSRGDSRSSLWIAASTLVVLAAVGCSRRTPEGGVKSIKSAITTNYTITLQAPKGVKVTSVALATTNSALVGSSSSIGPSGTPPALLANMGSQSVNLGALASVSGDVWSASPATIGSSAYIGGKLHAVTTSVAPGATIDGGIDHAPVFAPAESISWTIQFVGTGSNVSVSGGQTTTKAPGRYGTIHVSNNGTLKLSTGSYFVDSLQLDSGSHVTLTQTAGPVLLYVSTSINMLGSFAVSGSSEPPSLLLAFLGTAGFTIAGPFTGTVIANDSAQLTLTGPGTLTGAFFTKNLQVNTATTIVFRPANLLARAAGLPVDECVAKLSPAGTGPAADIQLETDMLRFCTATAIGPCEASIRARINTDFFSAVLAQTQGTMTSAQYVAIVREREAKLRNVRGSETTACNILNNDADGDFVPTGSDQCPNTPPLTPTLANGCTDTSLPQVVPLGPNDPRISVVLSGDPRCANAPVPETPVPLGAWRFPPDPTAGKAIWISRDPNTTSDCPRWYQVEFELTDNQGVRHFNFFASDDTTLPWITRPAAAVQFHLTTTDPDDRGAWASYGVYTRRYRTRLVNGSGRRSPWSNWFSPGTEDCLAGACGDHP